MKKNTKFLLLVSILLFAIILLILTTNVMAVEITRSDEEKLKIKI